MKPTIEDDAKVLPVSVHQIAATPILKTRNSGRGLWVSDTAHYLLAGQVLVLLRQPVEEGACLPGQSLPCSLEYLQLYWLLADPRILEEESHPSSNVEFNPRLGCGLLTTASGIDSILFDGGAKQDLVDIHGAILKPSLSLPTQWQWW